MTCCEACKSPVNVFARKKCSTCSRYHCSRCLIAMSPLVLPEGSSPVARWAAKNFSSPRRVCVKCGMLFAGDYSREDLFMRYTTREIRAYLISRHVVVDGCKEKADLVELAMGIGRGSGTVQENDIEHSIHVAQLKERMMSEMSSRRTTESSMAPSSSNVLSSSEPSRSTRLENQAPPLGAVIVDGQTNNPDLSGPENDPAHVNQHQPAFHETVNDVDRANDITVVSHETSHSGTNHVVRHSTPVMQRISLDDITDIDQIGVLAVRQLKEILVNSFVDYKGCCERQELVEHVIRLWIEHQRNKKLIAEPDDIGTAGGDFSNNAYEENICKICADAAIDCVLLECGHMVTCTACGKRLAECPICRRYVSRVVHVFRA